MLQCQRDFLTGIFLIAQQHREGEQQELFDLGSNLTFRQILGKFPGTAIAFHFAFRGLGACCARGRAPLVHGKGRAKVRSMEGPGGDPLRPQFPFPFNFHSTFSSPPPPRGGPLHTARGWGLSAVLSPCFKTHPDPNYALFPPFSRSAVPQKGDSGREGVDPCPPGALPAGGCLLGVPGGRRRSRTRGRSRPAPAGAGRC